MTKAYDKFLDILERRALAVIKSEIGKDALSPGELDASLLASDVQVLVKMARQYDLLRTDSDDFENIRMLTIKEVLKSNNEITGFVDIFESKPLEPLSP